MTIVSMQSALFRISLFYHILFICAVASCALPMRYYTLLCKLMAQQMWLYFIIVDTYNIQ